MAVVHSPLELKKTWVVVLRLTSAGYKSRLGERKYYYKEYLIFFGSSGISVGKSS